MSSPLNPSVTVVQAVLSSIQSIVKAELPKEQAALSIAGLLTSVNLWATQIPVVLEGSPSGVYANIIFAIRKELFHAPQFVKCILGDLNDLPPQFQEFLNFIWKLIEAQRIESPKVAAKVCTLFSYFSLLYSSLVPG